MNGRRRYRLRRGGERRGGGEDPTGGSAVDRTGVRPRGGVSADE